MPFNRFRTPRRQERRHRARPGDALDRRGDGHRRRLRHGVRQGAGRRRSARCRPSGRVFVSMANRDKRSMIFPVKVLADLGFEILATQGTAEVLRRNGVHATSRAQALRRARTQRRADHRPADPRRRDRPGHQHPARLVGPGGSVRVDGYEIRTAAVGADIPCITTVQGARRRRAGHRGAHPRRHRRPVAAGLGHGPGSLMGRRTKWSPERPERMTSGPYDALFDHVLTRIDPEHAHHLAFAGIRAARPATRLVRRARRRAPVERASGLTFPAPARPGGRLRQERRRHRRAGRARLRARRGRHGHRRAAARQPAGRGCSGCPPTARSSTGWASTTTAPRRSPSGSPPRREPAATAGPSCSASTSARPRSCPRTTRACRRLREVARGCSPRTPTTWSSTSARPTRPGCATSRPSSSCAPLLDAVRGRRPAPTGACRCWSRSPPTSPTRTSLAVADLALALGLDGIIATNTTITRDGPAHARPPRSRPSGPAGSPARRSTAAVAGGAAPAARRASGDRTSRSSASAASRPPRTPARGSTPARRCVQAYTGFVYGGPAGGRAAIVHRTRLAPRTEGASDMTVRSLALARRHGRRAARSASASTRTPPCCTTGGSTTTSPGWSGSRRPPSRRWPTGSRWSSRSRRSSSGSASRGVAVLERVDRRRRARPARWSCSTSSAATSARPGQAYADAYLDPATPLAADAITVSPYLGFGSLRPGGRHRAASTAPACSCSR